MADTVFRPVGYSSGSGNGYGDGYGSGYGSVSKSLGLIGSARGLEVRKIEGDA